MSWNYRVSTKTVDGVVLYGVVEVYYDSDGNANGWTDFVDPNGWEDIDDLKGTLSLMLEAMDKPLFEPPLDEEG